jgi:uncharacterized protein (TIGR04255 family)
MERSFTEPPRFDRPPVIETVLGVQFAPIPNFTASHYGWFWKEYLDSSWTKAQDAPRLPDQFELFGDHQIWGLPKPIFSQKFEPDRAQFINKDEDRLIQVQNTRFLYNWRKRESVYPSFAAIYPEFLSRLGDFERFLRAAHLEPTPQNQWELTYVSQIPKGELWELPSDYPGIFPGLFGRIERQTTGAALDSASSAYRFEIPPRRGRLSVHAQHVKNPDEQEVLQVSLTARGPIVPGDEGRDLPSGLTIGHAAVVQTFVDIASDTSLAYWGLR